MTYTVGDGDRLKVRASHIREEILFRSNELLKLAADAIAEGDNETASKILRCARTIEEAIRELREKMP